MSELQAMNMQRPRDTNFTPAAVAGALHVIRSNKLEDSSSESLELNYIIFEKIVLRNLFNKAFYHFVINS